MIVCLLSTLITLLIVTMLLKSNIDLHGVYIIIPVDHNDNNSVFACYLHLSHFLYTH